METGDVEGGVGYHEARLAGELHLCTREGVRGAQDEVVIRGSDRETGRYEGGGVCV